MPSELDLKYDDMLARVIGPGGRLIIGEDEQGRAIVTNFPATLPSFFRTFCALNAQAEGIVAGDERRTFSDLDAWSEQVAHALASLGIRKGDRVGIAMRNCPAWVVSYMGILKAGGVATLLNGWWQPHELSHALDMVSPKMTIADGPRARKIEGICGSCQLVVLPIERHVPRMKPWSRTVFPFLPGWTLPLSVTVPPGRTCFVESRRVSTLRGQS